MTGSRDDLGGAGVRASATPRARCAGRKNLRRADREGEQADSEPILEATGAEAGARGAVLELGAHSIALAALLAALASWLGQEGLRLHFLATQATAHSVGLLDYAQASLAGLAVALAFGLVLVTWRLATLGCVRLARRAGWATWPFDALLSVSLPGLLLGWFVTAGTRLGQPFTLTWWVIVVAVVAGGPLVLWTLRAAGRVAYRALRRAPRLSALALFLLAVVAAGAWVVGMAPHEHRYGPSHLFSFGLLLLFYYLLAGVLQRRWPLAARGPRAAAAAWVVLSLAAGTALLLPPSPASVELFVSVRPTKWVVRAAQGLLPDRDGDGVAGGIGLLVGRDCDDSDPTVSPERPEIVGNGRDDNCFGGDLLEHDLSLLTAELVAPPTREGPPHNVVFIVIDGWRFERGWPGGIEPQLLPVVTGVAESAMVFEDYRVCAPRTRESLSDLLGGTLTGAEPSPQRRQAIRALTEAGVHTLSVTSRWLRQHRRLDGWAEERFVEGRYGDFRDAQVVAEAIGTLGASNHEPFFLFVHLLSAHEPYQPAPGCTRSEDPRPRYDCALTTADAHIGDLLMALDATGLTERTVVVVTSDHGEEFGEHGSRFHASTLYDEILHVPLVIRSPEARVARITEPANCFDVMPTLTSAAGLPLDLPLLGRDLWHGAPASDGTHFARTRSTDERGVFEPRLHAVVYGGGKLILDRTSGLMRFYDLTADPGEQRPLATLAPELQRALVVRMQIWLSALARAAADDSMNRLDDWLGWPPGVRRLRALP